MPNFALTIIIKSDDRRTITEGSSKTTDEADTCTVEGHLEALGYKD